MDLFDGLSQAFVAAQSFAFIIAFLLGCLNGIVFGMLPGLSGSVGIALMIPFTYGMGATEAMALFIAALAGQTFSGSITAILLNTPGTSPNAATTFDGYPLARQGRGGFAIGVSGTASLLGALVGLVVLIGLFPVMRSVILAFSFPEFTLLGLLGIAAIAVAARGSMLKGLMSGLVGLLVSFVGFAPIGGDVRYVFGQPALYGGISMVAVLVGLFAISEALRLLAENQTVAQDLKALRFGRSQVWEGVRYTVRQPLLVLRSSLVGTGVGIVPAVGGTLAAFLAYFQASKTVKNPRFGRGDPRGVLAPEAAANAKDAGAALPTLAFGIPGSADYAIILGAMVIHGITPGPNLIQESPDVVWVAILTIAGAGLVSALFGMFAAPWLIQVTRLRAAVLAPVVVALAVTGAYALDMRPVDVLVALGFGLLGYAMKVIGMPVIPLILGLILGPMVERSYLQSLSTFGGHAAFVTRPISLALVIVIVGILGYEVYSARRERRKQPGRAVDQAGLRTAVKPLSITVVGGIGLAAAAALVLATSFSADSRKFPSLTAWLLVALVATYLAVALVPGLRARFGGLIADTGGMESMTAHAQESAESVAGQAGTGAGTASGVEPAGGAVGTLQATRVQEDSRRLTRAVLVVVALAVLAALVGLAVAVPVSLVLLLRFVSGESWRSTILVTVGTSVFLYLGFVKLLRVPLEGGMLLPF